MTGSEPVGLAFVLWTVVAVRERRMTDLVREDVASGAGAELRVDQDRVVVREP